MGAVAGRALGVGKVQLTGTTSNRQRFDATPQRSWYVTASGVGRVFIGPLNPSSRGAEAVDRAR